MEAEILDRIHIAIEGYIACQHLVIYQIERADGNYMKKTDLAKLRFDYNVKSGKIKLYPPFYCAESFEHMKDECREKLREWLKEFKKHYRQYYEKDFFKIDVPEKIDKDLACPRIIICIAYVEDFLNRLDFEEDSINRLDFEEDSISEIYDYYEEYKKDNDCEITSSRGVLLIKIRPEGSKEQDYVIAEMGFDIWHIDSDGVPTAIDEFYEYASYNRNTCLGSLSDPCERHKDFTKESVKLAVRKKLISWIEDFEDHYNTYIDIRMDKTLSNDNYPSINGTHWRECNNRGELLGSKSQEIFDEYTDNYDDKDDFDLERDEYDEGYREDYE
ncbi:MAG: hypothetical protein EOL98_01390 [Negativicutes bacterium]|nr:hypothetical protein [Negativicutes bacterium]